MNGDGRSDVCGRGAAGLYCAVSDGARFGEVQRSTFQGFADSDGVKDAPSYNETITFLLEPRWPERCVQTGRRRDPLRPHARLTKLGGTFVCSS
ncbi:hypothetical protein [Sorangium sp. So ce542]|uniref:hypothetical protein n=1 Tax=Sorangium sp. So ce542 TaxID=3133316 RepID=UPI003F5F9DE2